MDHETMPHTDDAALAGAWAAGDEQGFAALVTRYAPLVYHRCRRALGTADADDATQSVFLVLARKRAQATASPALAAWLLTVADFVIRNARRDRRRRRDIGTPNLLSTLPAPEPAMTDLQEHLDACLAELPAAEREAVRLHHLAGHTLAEVAAHTGAPLSTVHDRVRRGLERLRTLLVRRGVHAASIAAILACCQAEAGAATMPAHLMDQLRELAPADGIAAASTAISARSLRWAHPGMSPMSKITLAASLLALTGVGAAVFLTSAEAGTTSMQPEPVVVAPASDPAIDPPAEYDLDPERARAGITVRWNNGARTAERLRTVPEIALLAEHAPALLDLIGGITEGGLVWDEHSGTPRERVIAQYRLQREMPRLSPAERSERMEEMLDAQMAQPGQDDPPALPFVGGLHGWIECADAETLRRITDVLNQPSGFFDFLASVEHPEGWMLGDGLAKVVQQGSRLIMHPQRHQLDADMVACLAHRRAPDADLELTNWFDSGLPGSHFHSQGIVQLRVTPDGLRFSSTSAWPTSQQRTDADAWPRIDLARFDAIPAQAFLACAVALSAEASSQSVMIQSMVYASKRLSLPDADDPDATTGTTMDPVVNAFMAMLPQINGACVLWIEPGIPLPHITCEIDLPRSAAETLIASSGQPLAADGSISETTGFVTTTMGWRDGRLIFTTVPGGLDAIDRSGGFTAHLEVQSAFATMTKHPQVSVIMRPAAFVAYVAPFAAMAGPEWTQRLLTYEERLNESSASAFFTVASDNHGVHMDAAGVLALVAGAVLQAVAQNPLCIN